MVPPTRVHAPPGSVPCGWCGNPTAAGLPFCAHCGRRPDVKLTTATSCAACGATVRESDSFCSACGVPLRPSEPQGEAEVHTLVFSAHRYDVGPRLAVLDENGEIRQMVPMTKLEMTIGRGQCDLSFAEDAFLSPIHAQVVMRDGGMFVRDLGSCNRTWVYLEARSPLMDDDCLLLGSQILQFRRIGSPAPLGQEADGTRRIGSVTPAPDLAVLVQLRADGSVRDTVHLGPGRPLVIGRDTGDWTFPYDHTMSGTHAEIRYEDGRFVIRDLGSRNGVAVAVRGDRPLAVGQRLLVGDHILRVESV